MGKVPDTSQCIESTDIHRARAANALPARPPERQRRVHFIFNLDQSVQHHGTAPGAINIIGVLIICKMRLFFRVKLRLTRSSQPCTLD